MCQLIAANCICDPITEIICPVQSRRKSRWRRDENAVWRWAESVDEAGKGSVVGIRSSAIIVAVSVFDNERRKDQATNAFDGHSFVKTDVASRPGGGRVCATPHETEARSGSGDHS